MNPRAGGWGSLTVLLLLCADAATQPHAPPHAHRAVRVSSFPGAARAEQSVEAPRHTTEAEESAAVASGRATRRDAHSTRHRQRAGDAERSVDGTTAVTTGRCPLQPARGSPCAMGW